MATEGWGREGSQDGQSEQKTKGGFAIGEVLGQLSKVETAEFGFVG